MGVTNMQIRAQTCLISKEVKLRESLPLRVEMAQLDGAKFCCSICLDLLKDPVAIPCGHSYCLSCIEVFWDEKDEKRVYSCPQCRQTFMTRPVLVKNTMLADLMEELKKTGLHSAAADLCYAGPEDVACDFCTGRKLRAIKSCLACVASYCEKHLQPHYDAAPLKRHKLVEPSRKLQENVCPHHGEVTEVFCRADQQVICSLCSEEEHQGHDTVSAASERTERQRELEASRQNIQQRIQDAEKDVKLLQQEAATVDRFADESVEESEKVFTELIRLIQKRSSDVKQQIRTKQETEVGRVKELQEKLQQEISKWRRKDAELKQTEDHDQFLHNYPPLPQIRASTEPVGINVRPLRYFEDVTAAMRELRDRLQDVLRDKWTKISLALTEVEVLLPQPEPKTRDGFLKYSCKLSLDPNTAHEKVSLSEGDRKATSALPESRPSHPDRFTADRQVLSREGLTGRCYWEVERGREEGKVAVAYKNISRAYGGFGDDDKSWALCCDSSRSFGFQSNGMYTSVPGPWSYRIGVYLDHKAGVLSFYSVSETMTLLHRVRTTFTQPLYAGLSVGYYYGCSAELCGLKE